MNSGDINDLLNKCRDFRGIPYDEKIVPFPNFHTILLQHLQFDEDRVFMDDSESSVTVKEVKIYSDRLALSLKAQGVEAGTELCLTYSGALQDHVVLISLLNAGMLLRIEFGAEKCGLKDMQGKELVLPGPVDENAAAEDDRALDIPFIGAESPAVLSRTADGNEIIFSQYNLMSAAQGLGKAFSLFRPGTAGIVEIPDGPISLMHSFLVPYYWGKSMELLYNKGDKLPDAFSGKRMQYCYLAGGAELLKVPAAGLEESDLLRDACILIEGEGKSALPRPFKRIQSCPWFFGMGAVHDHEGNLVEIPGLEVIIKDNRIYLKGHALFQGFSDDTGRNMYGYIDKWGLLCFQGRN